MRSRHLLSIAATVVTVGAVLTPLTAGQAKEPAVGKTTQTLSKAERILAPTWQTFSTAAGRGTRITISTGGNLTTYTSPNLPGATYEHIGVGSIGEGYVLCYAGLAGSNYDLGSAQSGFNAPVTTATTTTRTTTDGRASLAQSFTFTPGGPVAPTTLLVNMTVRNLSGVALNNIVLRRQVDFDIDTGGPQGWAGFNSNHARTKAAVMAFHDPVEAPAGAESHGIMLANVQAPPNGWATLVTASILDTACAPAPAPFSPTFFVARGDYGNSISFNVGNLAPGASRTVAVRYQRY